MRDREDEKRIKEYMAAKMTHIKMYDECMNLADGLDVAKFAELVRADERKKVKEWVGLSGDEREHFRKLGFVGVLAVENKLKEKNT